jgi:hypothetical protein
MLLFKAVFSILTAESTSQPKQQARTLPASFSTLTSR